MIILIAGANGVGKTTLSLEIRKRFPAQIISTSAIREALRTVANKETNPELFLSTYRLDGLTQDSLDRQFKRQASLVLKATAAVLNRNPQREVISVVEGVHVLPAILHRLSMKPILTLLLRQPSTTEHWSRLVKRGKTIKTKPITKYEGRFHQVRQIGDCIEKLWLSVNAKEANVQVIHEINAGLDVAMREIKTSACSGRDSQTYTIAHVKEFYRRLFQPKSILIRSISQVVQKSAAIGSICRYATNGECRSST